MPVCENREDPGYIQNKNYQAVPNREKELRRERKLKGIQNGHTKAVRFYNLVFGWYDDLPSKRSKEYKRYRGIFTKTRPGKYFNKDYDWNNKKIVLVNRYIWMTEAKENIGVCRIFRKKAKGVR